MIRISVVGERIDTDASSGHKIAGYFEVFGIHETNQVLHDDIHTILMEVTVVSEGEKI
jgi:hypothetical protein